MEPLMPSVSAPQPDCPAQSGFLFGDEHPLIKQKHIRSLSNTNSMNGVEPTQEGLDGPRVSDVHPAVEDRKTFNEVAELTIASEELPEALEVKVETLHRLERETTVNRSSHSTSNFTEQKELLLAEEASVEDALRTQDGSSLAAITKHLSKLHIARIHMTEFAVDTTLQPKTVSSLPADHIPETAYQPFVVHKSHEPSALLPSPVL